MVQEQNIPQNNKQEDVVEKQEEHVIEREQAEAENSSETASGTTPEATLETTSEAASEKKQHAEIGDAVRDEALSAAEKGLEAARAALEAAEKKLAEAQQAAYGYSTVGQTTNQAHTADENKECSSAYVSSEAKSYAPPQGVPQQPASQFSSSSGSGQDFSTQASQGSYNQASQPTDQQAAFFQQGNAAYQQGGEAYQQQGGGTYQYQEPTQQQPPAQDATFQAAYQQPSYQQTAYQQAGTASYQQTTQAYSQGAGQTPYTQPQPNAASYQYSQQPPIQPHYVAPVASRDHVAAGLLAIFLGFLGIHKFYLGYNTQGFIMLAIALIGGLFSFGLVMGVVWIIGIVEGIIYLTKSQSEFERLYIYNKREWF